jgi:hypothetical protein
MNRSFVVLYAVAAACGVFLPRAEVQKKKPVASYGKKVSFLKMFGQRNWREAAAGAVTGANIYHASGVVVDRSRKLNAIYVQDGGDNISKRNTIVDRSHHAIDNRGRL